MPFAVTYFIYESMAALSVPIKDKLDLTNAQLGLVFSAYSMVGPEQSSTRVVTVQPAAPCVLCSQTLSCRCLLAFSPHVST